MFPSLGLSIAASLDPPKSDRRGLRNKKSWRRQRSSLDPVGQRVAHELIEVTDHHPLLEVVLDLSNDHLTSTSRSRTVLALLEGCGPVGTLA